MQCSLVLGVSRNVALKFWEPILQIGARLPPYAFMLMPKTPVNENYFQAGREHQIGLAGHVGAVQSVSISKRMNQSAHGHFRRCILASDTAHVFAAVHGSNL
jgi:hypothetical protein